MTQTTVEMYSKVTSWVFEMLKQQGVNFLLLGVAVWYLNSKLERVEDENRDCNNKVIEMYETILIANQQVIEKNTLIIKSFSEHRNEVIENKN